MNVEKPLRNRLTRTTALVPIIAVLLLAGCAGAPRLASTPTPKESVFVTALHDCDLLSISEGITLGDDGDTLTLDGAGREDTGIAVDDERCILKALKITDAATELMNTTRALDGRQTTSWAHVNAAWTYHPDHGLDIILTKG